MTDYSEFTVELVVFAVGLACWLTVLSAFDARLAVLQLCALACRGVLLPPAAA